MRNSLTLVGAVSLGLAACSGEPVTDETEAPAEESESAELPAGAEMAADGTDALVPGTDYNATSIIPCGFDGADPVQTCDAGVVRNWGEDGNALVEVQKPDGFKRAIFFDGLDATGADSAQADGSAGWDFKVTRDGDRQTISFGPETYVIVDALIEGG